ncbi:hypothetical protein ACFX13_038059 [Malus domestica]
MHAEIQPQDLSTLVVSNVSQGSGEYFSWIGIGTPVKSFYMVLDTGNNVNWLYRWCRWHGGGSLDDDNDGELWRW